VDEVQRDPELIRLTADAKRIDDQLAELQPKANASRQGSAERRRYAELRDRSEAAWRWVRERLTMLKSSSPDIPR
jgi:hypothetical protein